MPRLCDMEHPTCTDNSAMSRQLNRGRVKRGMEDPKRFPFWKYEVQQCYRHNKCGSCGAQRTACVGGTRW